MVKEPNQVAVGIQVILLCGLNQAVDHSAGLSAGRGVGKEPVLPTYNKGLYAALGTVVGELQPAVLQICNPRNASRSRTWRLCRRLPLRK